MRTLAVWCPDWPVIAAGGRADRPAAVVHAGQIFVSSAAARAEGVRRGQRRREAQFHCPELEIHTYDPARDARAFEPVVGCVESLVPGVEIVRPGLSVVAARGAIRYYHGELPLMARIAAAVSDQTGYDVQLGIADGVFAAVQAAYEGRLVPSDEQQNFLAGVPIRALERSELAGLLVRLGIRTLGGFAALPRADVAARFGPDAAHAHDLARGLDRRPPNARVAPPDLAVEMTLDPPVDRVDTATFAAKALAERLRDKLAARALACTRITIEAGIESGELLTRSWRHGSTSTSGFTTIAVADRARWQLDGWLAGSMSCADGPPRGSINFLRLAPDDVVQATGHQLALYGRDLCTIHADGVDRRDRVEHALARVQGLLGFDAVATAVVGGGRDPLERVRLVSWGEPRDAIAGDDFPWPARIPAPAPAKTLEVPWRAVVTDDTGAPVTVSSRHTLSARPSSVRIGQRPVTAIVGWAGPWCHDVRWWDPEAADRSSCFQVVTADGAGWLLACSAGQWFVLARYD